MAELVETEIKMFCGSCPDSHCGKLLYFMSNVNSEVECSDCGQKHKPDSLLNVHESKVSNVSVENLLKSILLSNTAAKKGSELIRVRGLSNFHCKLISPLLTSYGMDKKSGKAKLLSELGQPEIFNCAVFGDRAFFIEKEHLDTPGYGRDDTGSLGYLNDTLGSIEQANGGNCLIPLHSDGDGHCLVHAISRAVVGRELLWHSLRQNLKDHLQEENIKYQGLFRDFIDAEEWKEIINEADPNYHPDNNEPFGLRNIHVFGLANVLRRPIILLDNLEGMQSSGDYSGIFLPVLASSEDCKSHGSLNKPLVIAWSSSARNHYVPLVGVKDSPLPKIPQSLLPKAWGIPNEMVLTYIDFDDNSCCEIGGSRSLPDSYVQRLVSAMDEVFFQSHQVCPELVADVNQFVFKPANAVGFTLPQIIEFTQEALASESLFRCLSCQALKQVKDHCPRSWREPNGKLYLRAQESDAGLVADAIYMFTEASGVPFMYSGRFDMLVPVKDLECDLCKGIVREVSANGSVRYMNGDRTSTKSTSNKGCGCGFKHFWNGLEYNNVPKVIDVSLEWNGKKIEEQVFWFDKENDPSLNSNVYEIATTVVQKHFPGEFGSETLVRKVVDKILRETELKKNEEDTEPQPMDTDTTQPNTAEPTPTTPTKIILPGPKHKTLHKEELTMSEEERLTKARITHRAAFSQKRKSAKQSPEKTSGTTKHGKQEIQKSSKNNTQSRGENTTSLPKPPTPANASNIQAKPKDIKIRLTSSNGRSATITLKPGSTHSALQDAIQAELGITKDRQKIRYGFPPRELKPPENEQEPLPLTHGDRVSVEELPEIKAQEEEKSVEESGAEAMDLEEKSSVDDTSGSLSDTELEGVDRERLATDLLNLLQGALNVDQWESVQDKPELFARGGAMYEQVASSFGPLQDDMHCNIRSIPGKTFAYNAKEDRFELCLGQKHIPVQPLDQESLSRAHNRSGDVAPLRRPSDEREGLGSFSGALRHRGASEGRAAFSGTGHTLGGGGDTGNEQKKEKNLSYDETSTVPTVVASMDTSDNTGKQGTLVDPNTEVILTGQLDHGMGKDTKEESLQVVSEVKHDVETGGHEVNDTQPEGGSGEHEVAKNVDSVSGVEHDVFSAKKLVHSAENETEQSENEMEVGSNEEQNTPHAVSSLKNDVTKTENEDLNEARASSATEPDPAKNDIPSVENAHTELELSEISHESHSEI